MQQIPFSSTSFQIFSLVIYALESRPSRMLGLTSCWSVPVNRDALRFWFEQHTHSDMIDVHSLCIMGAMQ